MLYISDKVVVRNEVGTTVEYNTTWKGRTLCTVRDGIVIFCTCTLWRTMSPDEEQWESIHRLASHIASPFSFSEASK